MHNYCFSESTCFSSSLLRSSLLSLFHRHRLVPVVVVKCSLVLLAFSGRVVLHQFTAVFLPSSQYFPFLSITISILVVLFFSYLMRPNASLVLVISKLAFLYFFTLFLNPLFLYLFLAEYFVYLTKTLYFIMSLSEFVLMPYAFLFSSAISGSV